MNATKFSELLSKLNACSEAREWASGKTLLAVWRTGHRADWLLWLFGKMAGKPGWPSRNAVILAACDCAETAFKYLPEGETRPQECVRVVRAFCTGAATIKQVRLARIHASAADAASAAYAAASAAAAAADQSRALKSMSTIVRRSLKVPSGKQ